FAPTMGGITGGMVFAPTMGGGLRVNGIRPYDGGDYG
ncbi:MAG: hypothetical protein RL076_1420, partial [Chloroflexota bacterium]